MWGVVVWQNAREISSWTYWKTFCKYLAQSVRHRVVLLFTPSSKAMSTPCQLSHNALPPPPVLRVTDHGVATWNSIANKTLIHTSRLYQMLQAHVLRYLQFLSVDVITRNNKLLPFLGKYPTQTKAPVNYALNIQREWASYILQQFAQII